MHAILANAQEPVPLEPMAYALLLALLVKVLHALARRLAVLGQVEAAARRHALQLLCAEGEAEPAARTRVQRSQRRTEHSAAPPPPPPACTALGGT